MIITFFVELASRYMRAKAFLIKELQNNVGI